MRVFAQTAASQWGTELRSVSSCGLQIQSNVSVSWDACNVKSGKSSIQNYTVCLETRPGAADVASCVDVATAMVYDFNYVLEPVPHGTQVCACKTGLPFNRLWGRGC